MDTVDEEMRGPMPADAPAADAAAGPAGIADGDLDVDLHIEGDGDGAGQLSEQELLQQFERIAHNRLTRVAAGRFAGDGGV